MDYSKQRGDALLEQDVARKEKLARLQRDFRITSFQRRERELEASVDDLQAKLDERLVDTDSQAEKLKTQNTTLVDQATHREKELEELQQEIEGLQVCSNMSTRRLGAYLYGATGGAVCCPQGRS